MGGDFFSFNSFPPNIARKIPIFARFYEAK